jgi:predicted metal-dependent HD superfamily phosphohydrolase
MEIILKERFNSLWNQYVSENHSEHVFSLLTEKYTGSDRFYHNLHHVKHCLENYNKCKKDIIEDFQIELAIWFHDVINEPKMKDNEEESARVFGELAQNGHISKDAINMIKKLILTTKHNVIPQNLSERVIVDVDLSIFGAPEQEFEKYDNHIRQEYSFVEENNYRKARSEILESFLNRDSIFCTSFFRKRYEENARTNLRKTIEKLSKD